MCYKATMSSVRRLREFVSERLTAAAEEIFGVFEKTVMEYEEEIERQRRLLDLVWKPEVRLHRMEELTQQHVCGEEEEIPTDRQLCDQEETSDLDQKDRDCPQIKEEQEELCTSLAEDVEPLVVKAEMDTFRFIPAYEESDNSDPGPNGDHQPNPHGSPVAENPVSEGTKHVESASGGNSEQKPKKRSCKNSSPSSRTPVSQTQCESRTDEKSFECDFCGKTFRHKSNLNVHLRIHTGEEPYVCKTCGKRFRQISALKVHLNVHTGTIPYSCRTCGKGFTRSSNLLVHLRTHTGEKPYACETCGKGFTHKSNLLVHLRTHTGERPYCCQICGMCFIYSNELTVHMRDHTGEKPYTCSTCGEKFSGAKLLRNHVKIHTTATPCCTKPWEAEPEPGQQPDHLSPAEESGSGSQFS